MCRQATLYSSNIVFSCVIIPYLTVPICICICIAPVYVIYVYVSCILIKYEWICVMPGCVCGGGAERRARGQWVRWQHSEGVGLGLGPVPADALRSYLCKWSVCVWVSVCVYVSVCLWVLIEWLRSWVGLFDSMDQCTPWKSIYDGNEWLACFLKSVALSEGRWDVCVRVIGEAVMLVVHGWWMVVDYVS